MTDANFLTQLFVGKSGGRIHRNALQLSARINRHAGALGEVIRQILPSARDESGAEETLASFGTIAADAETRTLSLGTARSRTVEVRVAPLADIESQATVNAVTILLGTIHDLERAQTEREERLTLWPIDELPFDSRIPGRVSSR